MTPASGSVRLCHLYPNEMNVYADRGNIAVLRQRLAWRGWTLEVTEAGIGDEIDGDAHDFFYLGGGQDRDQEIVAGDMVRTKGDALRAAADRGAVQLYVCGGIQLAGHWYETVSGERLDGVGVLDLTTTAGQTRLIGDIVIDAQLDAQQHAVVGYENHAGRTALGAGSVPLGTVRVGHGNNDRDRGEGAVTNHVVGTYLHGPLLPRNPWLADLLLAWAVQLRNPHAVLEPLPDDRLEHQAHQVASDRAGLAR